MLDAPVQRGPAVELALQTNIEDLNRAMAALTICFSLTMHWLCLKTTSAPPRCTHSALQHVMTVPCTDRRNTARRFVKNRQLLNVNLNDDDWLQASFQSCNQERDDAGIFPFLTSAASAAANAKQLTLRPLILISDDTEHLAVSLRQLSFLFS